LRTPIRDDRIADGKTVTFPIQHAVRFDPGGKLDADDWLVVPRERVRADLSLNSDLAGELVRLYTSAVGRRSLLPVRVVMEAGCIRLQAPLGKTAMLLVEPEWLLDDKRAETSWRIAGGFMLAHRVNYGGRFYLGVEWQDDNGLRVYSATRRFPPRLVDYLGVPRGIAVYHRTQGRSYKRVQEEFLKDVAAHVTAGAVE
jgi:hypothetical protein